MLGATPVAKRPKAFGSFAKFLMFLISSGVIFCVKSILSSEIPIAIKTVSNTPLNFDLTVGTVL